MTYDEAVQVLDGMHSGAHATSEQMLDAIGYRQTQELSDQLSREVGSLRAVTDRALGNYDAARTVLRAVEKERETARELADRLAGYISEVLPDEPDSQTREYEVWMSRGYFRLARALNEWDVRDWKPTISPPGSGLDGLLADINRSDP